MNIKKARFIYFSPTGTSKRVAEMIKEHFDTETECYDVTNKAFEEDCSFDKDDVLIISYPVYCGRVPELACERIENLKGNNTPAVIIATYGNRLYEDALLEMKDILHKRGFVTKGAAAVVAEHSVVRTIAAGRPDENDKAEINKFAEEVVSKLSDAEGFDGVEDINVPGSYPYRRRIEVSLLPKTTTDCTKCGLCIKECPVGAISMDDDGKVITNKNRCINCVRCIRVCPKDARTLGKIKNIIRKTFLTLSGAKIRKPNEFYI